jgi:hypothetical protein
MSASNEVPANLRPIVVIDALLASTPATNLATSQSSFFAVSGTFKRKLACVLAAWESILAPEDDFSAVDRFMEDTTHFDLAAPIYYWKYWHLREKARYKGLDKSGDYMRWIGYVSDVAASLPRITRMGDRQIGEDPWSRLRKILPSNRPPNSFKVTDFLMRMCRIAQSYDNDEGYFWTYHKFMLDDFYLITFWAARPSL